jgi:predicted transcriptional regulator
MPNREPLRDEAILFGANSMYEVLETIAKRQAFHGAEVAAAIGRTRAQTQRELSKLRRLGVVKSAGRAGAIEALTVAEDDLARTILALPELLRARVTENQ